MTELLLRTGELETCRFIKPWLTVLDYKYIEEADNGVIVRLGDGDKLVKLKMNTYTFDQITLQYFMKNQFRNYYPYITTIGETKREVTGKMEHTYIYESYELYQYITNQLPSDETTYHTPLFDMAISKYIRRDYVDPVVPNDLSINWDNVLWENVGENVYLLGYPDPNDMLYYHNITDDMRNEIKREYLNDPEFRIFEEVIDKNNRVHRREVDGLPKDPELVRKRDKIIQEVTWEKMGQRLKYVFFLLFVDSEGNRIRPHPIKSLRDLNNDHRKLIRDTKSTILKFYKRRWNINYEDVFIYHLHSLIGTHFRSSDATFHFYAEYTHPYSFIEFFRKESDRLHTIDHILNNLKYSDYYENIPLRYHIKTQSLFISGIYDHLVTFLNSTDVSGNIEYKRMSDSIKRSVEFVQEGGMIDTRVHWIGDIRGEQRRLIRDANREYPRKRAKSLIKGRYMGCVRNYEPIKYKDYYYLLIREFDNLLTFIQKTRNYNKMVSDRDEEDFIRTKIDQFKKLIHKKARRISSEGYYNVSNRIYYHPLIEGILRGKIVNNIKVELLDKFIIRIDRIIENIDNLQVIDSNKHYKLLIRVNNMFSSNKNLISEKTLHTTSEYQSVEDFFTGIDDLNKHYNKMRDLSRMDIGNPWEQNMVNNCLTHLKNLIALSYINKNYPPNFKLEELAVYKQLITIYWKYNLTDFVIRRFSQQSNKFVNVIGYFKGSPTKMWYFRFVPILIQEDFEELLGGMRFTKIMHGVDETKFYRANSNIFNYRISGKEIDPKEDYALLKKYAFSLYVQVYENKDIRERVYNRWLDNSLTIDNLARDLVGVRRFLFGDSKMIRLIYKYHDRLVDHFGYPLVRFSPDNSFLIFPDPKWVGKDGSVLKEIVFNSKSPKIKEIKEDAYFIAYHIQEDIRNIVEEIYHLLENNKPVPNDLKILIPNKKIKESTPLHDFRDVDTKKKLDEIINLVNTEIGILGFNNLETFTRGNLPLSQWLHIHFKSRYSPFVTEKEKEATIDRMGKTFNTLTLIDNLLYDINYYKEYEHVFVDIVRSITMLNNVTDYNLPDEYLPYAPNGTYQVEDRKNFIEPYVYVYVEPL